MNKQDIEHIEQWLHDTTPQSREDSQVRGFILRCLIRWRNMNAAARRGLEGLDSEQHNPRAA